MRNYTAPVFIFIFFFQFHLAAQNSKISKPVYKFGDIKVEDFSPNVYDIDSGASAIVLADIGSSRFEGNNQGDFSIIYNRFKRIRIINKNGFEHTKFDVVLYKHEQDVEKMDNLEAVTYNIENGTIIPSKLEKNSVYKSELVKDVTILKFSMPNVKEGSIIEVRYTITTPFYNLLREWKFQSEIPTLWSQYEVTVPSLFNYVLDQQGFKEYDMKESKTKNENYRIHIPGDPFSNNSRIINMNSDVYYNFWAIKNLPALKAEAYTSSLNNYIQKIDFQMKSIKWPDGTIDDRMGSWQTFSEKLLKEEYFGRDLQGVNLSPSELNNRLKTIASEEEKAVTIYKYVRDNFTCTDQSAIYVENNLRKVSQNKKGNVAEINLLLTNIYKSHGFTADPVMLSTKDHGKVSEVFPLRAKFNYVISRVKVNDNYYLLDASDNTLGFGILPLHLYNGSGRLIGDPPIVVPMYADSLKEKELTSIFIYNDEDNKGMNGKFTSRKGTFGSLAIRKKVKQESKTTFFDDLKKGFLFDVKITNEKLDSLADTEKPITLSYDINFKKEGDLMYFNPMLSEAMKSNPFKSEERQYPVEMPYRIIDTYLLDMEIPKGYKIDEVPKSTLVKLNGDEGFFEYMTGKTDEKVQLRVRLVLNKATFLPDDYKTLRDFYGYIVKKESEMIVFKKIN